MEILVLIIVTGLAVLVETVLYNRLGGRRIRYTITLNKEEVYEGEIVELTEEVENGKWLPLPWLKTEISTSKWLEFYGITSVNKDDTRFVPSVFALRPYQRCRRVWRIKCQKRGIYDFCNTSISGSDLFGLVRFTCLAGEKARLTVLPTPLETNAAIPINEFFGDMIVRRFNVPDMLYPCGAREYTGHEPFRTINWNASAREGQLMVKEYDSTASCRMLILLNPEKSGQRPGTPLQQQRYEILIKAAAYAVEKAEEAGCEWALDGGEGVILPLSSGYSHGKDTLRALAEIEEKCTESFGRYLTELDSSPYTDILVITASIDKEYAEAAEALSNTSRVFVFSLSNESGYENCAHIGRGNYE